MLLWIILILKFVPFMGASPNALNTEPYKTPLIIPWDTAMGRAAISPTAQECQAVHSKLSHFYQGRIGPLTLLFFQLHWSLPCAVYNFLPFFQYHSPFLYWNVILRALADGLLICLFNLLLFKRKVQINNLSYSTINSSLSKQMTWVKSQEPLGLVVYFVFVPSPFQSSGIWTIEEIQVLNVFSAN